MQLNEAYFGNDAIKPVSSLFYKIRDKFRDKPYSTSMNIDKDVIKFNREIEKFFGFEVFAFSISSSNEINAYAFPVDIFNTPEERRVMINSLKAAKTGFKFDPKMGRISAVCTITSGALNSSLTNEELFAVILHEIGHTFFQAVLDKDCVYTVNRKMISIFTKINNKLMALFSKGETIDDENISKDVNAATNMFGKIKSFIQPTNIIQTIKNSKIAKMFVKESMDDNMGKHRIDYTNEKFADTFCTMYGFGVHLHTALMKMYDDMYKIAGIQQSKNPIKVYFEVQKALFFNLLYYNTNLLDEHPAGLTRIQVSIDYLKKELSRESLDPKMKNLLVQQINDLQKLIDDYVNFPKDEDNIKIIRTYYTKLYDKFGGDRREQDTDNDSLFDTIDDRYSGLIKR